MWMNQWRPVFEQQTAQDEVTKMYDKYQGHVASQYEQELAEHTVKYLQATHSFSATLVDTGLTRHISSKKLSGSTVFTTLPDTAVQILSHFICICITWHYNCVHEMRLYLHSRDCNHRQLGRLARLLWHGSWRFYAPLITPITSHSKSFLATCGMLLIEGDNAIFKIILLVIITMALREQFAARVLGNVVSLLSFAFW